MKTYQLTEGIEVSVKSIYRPEFSNPLELSFVHSYRISITNKGTETVQLMTRHWYIFDSNAPQREVVGDGVVGLQPILPPGTTHQYESSCELTSELGTMYGAYTMKKIEKGTFFNVNIPKFQLIAPMKLN